MNNKNLIPIHLNKIRFSIYIIKNWLYLCNLRSSYIVYSIRQGTLIDIFKIFNYSLIRSEVVNSS